MSELTQSNIEIIKYALRKLSEDVEALQDINKDPEIVLIEIHRIIYKLDNTEKLNILVPPLLN
jgi:hypothetical protein|tara:strand:+ start:88 stop:276 length:189 start_codon:yes stop_codon:yes gene_type:complete